MNCTPSVVLARNSNSQRWHLSTQLRMGGASDQEGFAQADTLRTQQGKQKRISARMLAGFPASAQKKLEVKDMAVPLVLGIIGTIVLLIILIRTRMGLQDRSLRFIFVLLFLMCIFVIGLAACGEYPPQDIPSGPPSYNLPTPTISGPNPLYPGTPCPSRVLGVNCGN